jgi:3-hydroxyacyl-[acyl-carrier-protein] dehydratase
MRFCLLDSVVELGASRIVTRKLVSNAEEYLLDHFPSFPVLPGVMMIEAMTQAARHLVEERVKAGTRERWVLSRVRALKYGRLVRPGDVLVVTVELIAEEGEALEFRGEARVAGQEDGAAAAAGRLTLRRVKGVE